MLTKRFTSLQTLIYLLNFHNVLTETDNNPGFWLANNKKLSEGRQLASYWLI